MDFLVIKFTFVITLLFTGVSCWRAILSSKELIEDDKFFIMCGNRHVINYEDNVSFVREVRLTKQTENGKKNRTIASYSTDDIDKEHKRYRSSSIVNSMHGRAIIVFYGDDNGIKNINRMMITINVNYAMCEDTGTYDCTVFYVTTSKTEFSRSRSEHLTVISKHIYATLRSLTTNSINVVASHSYYTVGDKVNLTCRATGSGNITLYWNTSPRNDNNDLYSDITPQTMFKTETRKRGGFEQCLVNDIVSTLSFTAQEPYYFHRHRCVAENKVDVVYMSVSIGIKEKLQN